MLRRVANLGPSTFHQELVQEVLQDPATMASVFIEKSQECGLSKLCYSTNYKRHLVQQFDLTFDLILDLGQDLSHKYRAQSCHGLTG